MADSSHVGRARGLTVPLNSKRLTVTHLRAIAKAMNLPTGASTDEVRQIIEGELSRRKKEPRNVQVVVSEDGGVILQDEDGPFLIVEEPQEDEELTETADDEMETTAVGDDSTS